MNKKTLYVFLILVIGLIFLLPPNAQMVEIENPISSDSFADLAYNIIKFIFNVALAIVPIMFIIAGLAFITAAGDPEKIKRAKDMVWWTIIGFMVILLANGIIQAIQEIFEE
ncbi:hypothetical protein KAU51_00650 [Candidatus Parcubacteria bacterium]|nr:hypothetical protein [Candidatus Parcubacteria bacterium]